MPELDCDPRQIDEIFAAYNQPQSPGCSVGVIRDGAFIFQKPYGEASLEWNVPFSSKSVFYMASVSKQLTAASIVLAAEQGSGIAGLWNAHPLVADAAPDERFP